MWQTPTFEKSNQCLRDFWHHLHSSLQNPLLSPHHFSFHQITHTTPPCSHQLPLPSFTTVEPPSNTFSGSFISSDHNSGDLRSLSNKAIGPADVMLPVTSSACNAAVAGMSSSSSSESSRRSKSRFISKPSWLLLSISDMEDKIQAINGEDKPDTFGERADFYYRKRPELLALIQDLYNRYLYLADRYTRTLSKQQPQEHVQTHEHELKQTCDNNASYSNTAETSLSTQPQKLNTSELVISELVMRFVEYEIVVEELHSLDTVQEESKKKIEIQKSLLDVLESERVVLTNENSRLASESLFMKRKAGELARCVLLERSEDQRVFVLSRKIDDLQGQIYELEKRNKEYYERLMKQEVKGNEGKKNNISINIKRLMVKNNGGGSSESISWSGEDETGWSMSSTSNSSTCTSLAQVMKEKEKKKKNKKNEYPRGSEGGKKGYGWWDRVRKFDMFMCGPHVGATC